MSTSLSRWCFSWCNSDITLPPFSFVYNQGWSINSTIPTRNCPFVYSFPPLQFPFVIWHWASASQGTHSFNLSTELHLITVLCSVVARDLTISPGIQDPSLNTAECVIQGHQPDIDATEVSSYIRAILYCSLVCVVLIGPTLGFFSLAFFGYDPAKKDRFNRCEKRQREPERPAPAQRPSNILCECNCCCCNGRFFGCYKIEDPFMRPAKYQGHPTRI